MKKAVQIYLESINAVSIEELVYKYSMKHLRLALLLDKNIFKDLSYLAIFEVFKQKPVKWGRFLIENGYDVDYRDGMALRCACSWENYEMVEFLLESGAKLDIFDNFLVKDAKNNGNIRLLEIFSKYE